MERIHFLLQPADAEAARQRASENDLTLSAWLRQIIRMALYVPGFYQWDASQSAYVRVEMPQEEPRGE